MLLKYINLKYFEIENEVTEIKNRMISRKCTSNDYAELALAIARLEATADVLGDISKILHKWS